MSSARENQWIMKHNMNGYMKYPEFIDLLIYTRTHFIQGNKMLQPPWHVQADDAYKN